LNNGKPDMLTNNQGKMVYWILERENIRKKKEAGKPKPWSFNPVMQETYFCNVNRENDRVTKWIRENWTYPKAVDTFNLDYDDTAESYTFAIVVARIFNQPDTLSELMQPIDFDEDLSLWLENAGEVLAKRKADGKRIWNGAYIISTNGKKMPKADYCIYLLETLAKHKDIIDTCTTLADAHKRLKTVEGLASFLAGQVVADLKNTEGHPLHTAPDWFTFSAPGPGSLRGLEWFWEKPVTAKNYQESIDAAYELLEWELPDETLETLCHQNLQNCFCEYDKFMRVSTGTGRSKRKYQGV